jgi:hypothetical protein
MRQASVPTAARFAALTPAPLYRRTLPLAMRPDIGVAPRPNDVPEPRFVEIGDGQPGRWPIR